MPDRQRKSADGELEVAEDRDDGEGAGGVELHPGQGHHDEGPEPGEYRDGGTHRQRHGHQEPSLHQLLDLLVPELEDPGEEGLLPRVHLDQPHGVYDLLHAGDPLVGDADHPLPVVTLQLGQPAHKGVEQEDEETADQRGGADQVDGVGHGEHEADGRPDEEGAHDAGLLDPLVVRGHEGDELAQGGVTRRAQPQQLGVAQEL